MLAKSMGTVVTVGAVGIGVTTSLDILIVCNAAIHKYVGWLF